MCVGAIRECHKSYPILDATSYIIGISVENWVKQCLLSVDVGCMGPIMPWFAFGFVMSDALFSRFCWCLCLYHDPMTPIPLSNVHMHPKRTKRKLLAIGPKEEPKYWHSMQDWLSPTHMVSSMLVTKLSYIRNDCFCVRYYPEST